MTSRVEGFGIRIECVKITTRSHSKIPSSACMSLHPNQLYVKKNNKIISMNTDMCFNFSDLQVRLMISYSFCVIIFLLISFIALCYVVSVFNNSFRMHKIYINSLIDFYYTFTLSISIFIFISISKIIS